MKFKAILFLLFCHAVLHSQTVLNIHVTDLQKRPVSFAVIKYETSAVTCNNSGVTTIKAYKAGSSLAVHKFGFSDTVFSIASIPVVSDTLDIVIRLRLKPSVLPEISVSSAAIKEVNPLKADFVLGYELKGNYIVELLSDDIILVTHAEKNEITFRSKPIRGSRDIVKDAYGTIHILTDKNAFKIYADSSVIKADTLPIDLARLNWGLQYCEEAVDTSLFIRRYKDNNQTVAFFGISSLHNKHVRQLKEISDDDRKNAVRYFANEANGLNYYLAEIGLSKMTANTKGEVKLVRNAQKLTDLVETNLILPSYSLLRLVNDSIYLFAHDIDTLFVYDQSWNLVKSKRIDYHHLKVWAKELIVNEEKTKVYAKLIRDSKVVLAEIDLQSGALKPVSTRIEANFPGKIKIRNNVAYFMAKQKSGPGYTVYAQKLEASR